MLYFWDYTRYKKKKNNKKRETNYTQQKTRNKKNCVLVFEGVQEEKKMGDKKIKRALCLLIPGEE